MAEAPHPVDVEVGRRLKQRRLLVGLSQTRLGELLGVTFQQVQKYERGSNRVSSSRLQEICGILQVPPTYFFAGNEARPEPATELARHTGLAEERSVFQQQAKDAELDAEVGSRETLQLVRAFSRITDPQVRRRIYDLVRTLADTAPNPRSG